MSIESLNKAVEAAGFAMAAPDDDADVEAAVSQAPESRALALIDPAAQPSSIINRETLTRLTNWVRGYTPGFGGRAPA